MRLVQKRDPRGVATFTTSVFISRPDQEPISTLVRDLELLGILGSVRMPSKDYDRLSKCVWRDQFCYTKNDEVETHIDIEQAVGQQWLRWLSTAFGLLGLRHVRSSVACGIDSWYFFCYVCIPKDIDLATPPASPTKRAEPINPLTEKHEIAVAEFPENALNLLPEELSQIPESPSRSPSPLSRPADISSSLASQELRHATRTGKCPMQPFEVDSPGNPKPEQDLPRLATISGKQQHHTKPKMVTSSKRKLGDIDFSTSFCPPSQYSSISPRYAVDLNT